ncbi:RICIN domain-containing protein [Streptomyces sp. NPDC005576]|uniref:NHL domain-containing protein n=1 Tax=Streptomyces sp. NPDC005576 TaxID=3364726 RepID=UPI00367367C7
MGTPEAGDTSGEDFVAQIFTVAGTGTPGREGDGGPAVSAKLDRPLGVVVDAFGTVYFSDFGNHQIRKITTDGKIGTVAGDGKGTYRGDNGPAASAQLYHPRELTLDSAGNLYVADGHNHRIRKITPDGTITTVAGTNGNGFTGDGGPATSARLDLPCGVAVDSAGDLYIADHRNHRIRRVAADGKISTIAGHRGAGFTGDGGPAASAQLNGPQGVTVDSADNLYVVDTGNHRIRKITPDGKITTVAGMNGYGVKGDGGPATSAQLYYPIRVVLDSTGALYIADSSNHRIRKVAPDGTISTVVGAAGKGFSGDGGPAASAQLQNPYGLAVDCVDTLYISDHANHRIRKITSEKMAGLPDSGAVVSWVNTRSKLRMGVYRESLKDGAAAHQSLASLRAHQKWRLIATGQADGEILYRIENVRSGKALEVTDAHETPGAPVAQRAYLGGDASHQQWRLITMSAETDTSRIYEIANHHSGLLLHAGTNAPTALTQQGTDGDHRNRQWQLLPA